MLWFGKLCYVKYIYIYALHNLHCIFIHDQHIIRCSYQVCMCIVCTPVHSVCVAGVFECQSLLCVHVNMYVYVSVCMCMCLCVCVCMYVCEYVCVYMLLWRFGVAVCPTCRHHEMTVLRHHLYLCVTFHVTGL